MAGNVTKKNTETGGNLKSESSSNSNVEIEQLPTLEHYNALVKSLDDLDKRVVNKINNFDKKIKKIEELEINLKGEIEDSKSKSIEILAIFVALFTFVSIEFQIFRSFTSWQAVTGLTFILLGALSSFALLASHLMNNKKGKFFFLTYIIPLIFCGIGIYFFQDAKIIDSEYIKISEDLTNTITNEKKNTKILECLENVGYFKKDCFK